MRLLIQRQQQSMPLGRIKFYLSSRLELDEDERYLVRKYKAQDAIVYAGDVRKDIIKSAIWAVPLTIIAVVALYVFISTTGIVYTGPTLGPFGVILAIYAILWLVVYGGIKETVTLADLMHGRAFKCRSILDIQAVEELLRQMAFSIAQLLDDMKNWGGREVVPVAPLIERNYASTSPSESVAAQ